jgi:two-component system response regulator YesN
MDVRVLIADDERLVRYSLESMLEELGVPSGGISAACNGDELVEMAAALHPDIALVDIKMPKLDGLSAIERARALSPGTRWVILTSHSSFDFARRAIELGVVEYLLKPVEPGDLQRLLSAIARGVRHDLRRQNEEFESRIHSLIHKTLSLDYEPVEFVTGARFLGAVVLFDSPLEERRLLERNLAACREMRARAAAAIGKSTRIALCTLPLGQLALVGAWRPEGDQGAAREVVRGYLHGVQSMLNSQSAESLCSTQIVSDECGSFPALLERLARAADIAWLRIAAGVGRQITLHELEREKERGRLEETCRAAAGLAQAHRTRSRLDFLSHLDRLEPALGELPREERDGAARNIGRFLRAALGIDAGTPMDGSTWKARLKELAETLRGGEKGAEELVAQAVSFVDANYMRDIGIGQIAVRLGVTPNYLSSVFHKARGVTFVKYVTRLRMEKARLLIGAGARVQDAARAVGYTSVRHFSRLFQKEYGDYPSAIQKRGALEGGESEKNVHES